ncbi:MAG TPA: hypothetical protein VEA58_09405 [Anaerovoracaceae bacterium]|nr:hypothetical protein [Anaerovoracaceae bacterium]
MNNNTCTPGKWQKAKIKKHTQIIVGNDRIDSWHKDMVGAEIEVRHPGWSSGYYEARSGDSILKADVEII